MTTPCAACKYLRRKCTEECLFAPYFPASKQEKYTAVHKVFGASHVATLLNDIHPSQREYAMDSLAFEAQARILDPVHGVCRFIYPLEHQLQDLQHRLAIAKKELASYTLEPPMTNYLPQLTAQQLQLHEDAQRFATAQTAQIQPTPETQRDMIDRDKKIVSSKKI